KLDDILALLPPGEEGLTCRFLYGLLVMGVAVYDPPVGDGPFRVSAILRDHADAVALERVPEKLILETYEGLKNTSPEEILGLPSQNVSREQIERAYQDAKDLVSRDRILPRIREKLRSELTLIESRLVEAYLTLTQARSEPKAFDASGGVGE